MTPELREVKRERAKALRAYLRAQDRITSLHTALHTAQGWLIQKRNELRAIDERMYPLEYPGEEN